MEDRFIADFILKYAEASSSPNSSKTADIYESTKRRPKGHMCLGPVPGFLIRAFLLSKQPSSILELGTFTGYVLSILNEFAPKHCKITTIDDDRNNTVDEVKKTFADEINSGKIKVIRQEGVSYLKQTGDIFDMIFIDARKDDFYNQLDLIHSKLSLKGLLICDNALAGLKVFAPEKEWEKCAVEFNKYLQNDDRFISMLLPLRDGFNISIKVK